MEDMDYGEKFLNFILNKRNPDIHIQLITDEALLDSFGEECLLITDKKSIYRGKYEEERVILLSNENHLEKSKISKYQKAENIYKNILMCLSKKSKEFSVAQNDFKGIHVVFSTGGDINNVFSAKLSQFLSKFGKTIHISLSPFPVNFRVGEKDLGDLIFICQERLLKKNPEHILSKYDDLYVSNSFKHYKDLLDCNFKDLKFCLDELKKELHFENIVIDMVGLYEFTTDLLNFADNIYYLENDEEKQKNIFLEYMKMDGYEDAISKIEFIKNREIKELVEFEKNVDYEGLFMNSDNLDLIENILNNLDKECVFDDFV